MSKAKEAKEPVYKTPRSVSPTGVFKRIREAERREGTADRVRHVVQERAKKY